MRRKLRRLLSASSRLRLVAIFDGFGELASHRREFLSRAVALAASLLNCSAVMSGRRGSRPRIFPLAAAHTKPPMSRSATIAAQSGTEMAAPAAPSDNRAAHQVGAVCFHQVGQSTKAI